jgi:hypothetical protein
MSRIRLIMLSLFAMFAMSAVASASASAEACHSHPIWERTTMCIENVEVNSPGETPITIPFTSTSGVSRLVVTGLGTITCQKDKNVGEFDIAADKGSDSAQVSVSDLRITFEECELEGAANCEVPNIVVEGGTGDNLDGTFVSFEQIAFSPSEGTIFTVIKLKNKAGKTCAAAGSYNVTGKQKCKLINPEAENKTHELDCKATESELEVGGKKATFESKDKVTLAQAEDEGDEYSFRKESEG